MLLPDIRCNFEKANIFQLPILLYNKGIIFGFINIICKSVDWLELIDNIVKEKFILIKENLITI